MLLLLMKQSHEVRIPGSVTTYSQGQVYNFDGHEDLAEELMDSGKAVDPNAPPTPEPASPAEPLQTSATPAPDHATAEEGGN
jgi:hypothetical protein